MFNKKKKKKKRSLINKLKFFPKKTSELTVERF